MLPIELIILGVGISALFIVVLVLRYLHGRQKTAELLADRVVLKIAVPRNNDKTAQAAEQLFTALHGVLLNKEIAPTHFSFEIASGSYGIHFLAVVSKNYKQFVENQIYAQYPDAQIQLVKDYSSNWDKGRIAVTEFSLKQPIGEIRTYPNFEVDPIAAITAALVQNNKNEVFLQVLCRAINNDWHAKAKELDSETKKILKPGFQSIIRVAINTDSKVESNGVVSQIAAVLAQFKTSVSNAIVMQKPTKRGFMEQIILGSRNYEKLSLVERYQTRALSQDTAAVLNAVELASIFHFPHISVETPNIAWSRSKKLEFPLNLPSPSEGRVLAETDYRNINQRFAIKATDRLRHMYIIGKTGVGKSTFMEQIILGDIYAGEGVGVIDPHGELIEHLLEKIPPERIKDVVIFDPGDTEFPVGLNMIESDSKDDKSLIADGIVSVFKKEFADSWGPRLEYILTNAILTLLHCQNVSMLVLPRLLSDTNYRIFLLKQVKDPILLSFWEEEYAQLAADPKRLQQEISSILNKVGRFTTNPLVRNIVGQVSSSLDFEEMLDSRKIFLVNLAQGKIGQENMALLGGMLVTRLYSTVTRRIKQQSSDRVPFYLFIDEFQNFSNTTFEKILSEARKFGLGLTIAHQFIDQIQEGVRNAVFGNVGSLINFAVGPRDADFLNKEFSPYLSAEDLINLGKHEMAMKLSIDIAQSKPFTAKSFLANFPNTNISDEIIAFSRETYAKPREFIEQKLYKWAEQDYNKNGNMIPKNTPNKDSKEKLKAEKSESDKPKPATEETVAVG